MDCQTCPKEQVYDRKDAFCLVDGPYGQVGVGIEQRMRCDWQKSGVQDRPMWKFNVPEARSGRTPEPIMSSTVSVHQD
jgi:hypothetical protein